MNTDQPSSKEGTQILTYKDHSIRTMVIDGAAYFALEDICAALEWPQGLCERVHRDSFPAYGKLQCLEDTDFGLENAMLINPMGVLAFTHEGDHYYGQNLAAWTKRESLKLCPDADPKDARMFVTMDAQGNLPPLPARYSGRRAEYYAIKDSTEYHRARLQQITGEANSRQELQRRILEEAEAARRAAA